MKDKGQMIAVGQKKTAISLLVSLYDSNTQEVGKISIWMKTGRTVIAEDEAG